LSPAKNKVTQLEHANCIKGERQTDKLYPFLVGLAPCLFRGGQLAWCEIINSSTSVGSINRDKKKE
jgi:hypothetical protein